MKLFIAGFENVKFRDILDKQKSLFVLGSFHYIRKLKEEELNYYMNFVKNECQDFILDSGAFSMLNANKNIDRFLDNLDSYVNDYIDFINRYDIKNFIELDIDPLVGYKKVLEIRKKIETMTNKKCIPVWHISRGIEEYIKHTKEYDYIAIGGIVTKEIKRKDFEKLFPKLLRIAKLNKCKVHGLGYTSVNCEKYDFDSIDSTSWSACVRFSRMFKFDERKKKMTSFILSTTNRLNLKENQHEKLLVLSLKEWHKFQKFLIKNEDIKS